MENALFEMERIDKKNNTPLTLPNNWDAEKSDYIKSKKATNKETEIVLDELAFHFFAHKKHVLLEGSAGTGKTTILQYIMQYHDKKRIAFLAPTNEAVAVLQKKLDQLQERYNVQYSYILATLHSALGCIIEEDEEGNPVFTITKMGKMSIYNPDYIIVDEASMMTEKLYNALMELGKPILFVGDSNQLPPVGDDFSVFQKQHHKIILKEKKRFKSERLKEFTDYLETAIKERKDVFTVMFEALKYDDVIYFANRNEKHEYDAYVGYTNQGGKIEFLKKHQETYVIGKKYYIKGMQTRTLTKGEKYILTQKTEKYIEEGEKKYKYYELKLKDKNEGIHTVLVWSSSSAEYFKWAKKELAKWKKTQKQASQYKISIALFEADEFLREELKEKVELAKQQCPFKNADVIKNVIELYPEDIYTVHASQGKTFDTVLVDAYSFRYAKGNEEKIRELLLKLMYVACTRASNKLLVYAYVPR